MQPREITGLPATTDTTNHLSTRIYSRICIDTPSFIFFFLGDRSLPSLLGKFDRSYVSLLPFPPPVNQLPVKKKERKERKERKIARVHQSGNWEQGGDKILLSRANFWFAIGRGGGIKEYVPYWYGMSNNNVEIKFCVVSDLRQGMSKVLCLVFRYWKLKISIDGIFPSSL